MKPLISIPEFHTIIYNIYQNSFLFIIRIEYPIRIHLRSINLNQFVFYVRLHQSATNYWILMLFTALKLEWLLLLSVNFTIATLSTSLELNYIQALLILCNVVLFNAVIVLIPQNGEYQRNCIFLHFSLSLSLSTLTCNLILIIFIFCLNFIIKIFEI